MENSLITGESKTCQKYNVDPRVAIKQDHDAFFSPPARARASSNKGAKGAMPPPFFNEVYIALWVYSVNPFAIAFFLLYIL